MNVKLFDDYTALYDHVFVCVCVFAALNGYYLFLFILYRNVFVLFYPFLCCYLCYFFRLYVFFLHVIALDQFYSLFVVSFFVCECVYVNPFRFPPT